MVLATLKMWAKIQICAKENELELSGESAE